VACRLCSSAHGTPSKAVRTCGTRTADLLPLAEWLTSTDGTPGALESTGVSWNPIYPLWAGILAVVVVVTARPSKNVPGRKTAVRAGAWRAALLRPGLLPPSFLPDRPPRDLRDLTRSRTSLVRERAAEVNRRQQV
jgi:transposase